MNGVRRMAVAPQKGRTEAPRMVAGGHVARLSVGQGSGFVRSADGRDIWFHRSDMAEQTEFNKLAVGDTVTFDLLEDPISGPRALRVRRNSR